MPPEPLRVCALSASIGERVGVRCRILAQACREFEERLGKVKGPRGEKTALIEAAIQRQTGEFGVSDLQNECPGVGVDLIRQVLKRLRGSRVACLSRGHAAKWKKLGNWVLPS